MDITFPAHPKKNLPKIPSTELKKLNKLKCPSEDTSVPLGREKKAITSGEVRDSQDSEGETFDEMPDSREREHIEPTSGRRRGHQVRNGVAIPQSHL